MTLSMAALTGCAMKGGTSPGTGGTTPPNYIPASGNWKFVPNAATVPANGVSDMSGVITESGGATFPHFVTSVLRLTSSCYTDAQIVPMVGSVDANTIQLGSFDVKDQTVTINATKDAAVRTLATTLSVSGGCANGLKQDFTGTFYAPLSGTYTGTITGTSQTLSVSLAQDSGGTGSGTFVLSPGSAATSLSGSNCFTSASVDANNSFVSGTTVTIITLGDPTSARLAIAGVINNTDASSLTVTPTIVGGNCAGSLGSVVLTKQP